MIVKMACLDDVDHLFLYVEESPKKLREYRLIIIGAAFQDIDNCTKVFWLRYEQSGLLIVRSFNDGRDPEPELFKVNGEVPVLMFPPVICFTHECVKQMYDEDYDWDRKWEDEDEDED